jgi:outer membrane protein assembly factor BamE (lipoprotein component of BamABCDE complex)
MWYYITDHKKSVEQNVKIHNYNNFKKCILQVQFCNKQSVGNMGIRLYNNMLYHI